MPRVRAFLPPARRGTSGCLTAEDVKRGLATQEVSAWWTTPPGAGSIRDFVERNGGAWAITADYKYLQIVWSWFAGGDGRTRPRRP